MAVDISCDLILLVCTFVEIFEPDFDSDLIRRAFAAVVLSATLEMFNFLNTILVVQLTLLFITQDFVGSGDLCELIGCLLITYGVLE